MFVLVAAPAAVASWSRRDAAPVAAPGVVVVCLDTLRADVLSLDSGRPVRMPRLEAFARESVTFADAIAPAAWTVPSVTSLLTGLDPGNTGVYGFPNTLPEIPRVVPTLPERLVDAGWQTAALTTSAWFGQGAPTLRGFRDGCVGLDLDPEAVLRAWDRRRSHDAPFFLFLHSMAAHDPYLDRDAVRIGARPRPESLVGEDAARMDRIVDAVRRRERPDPADLAWASEASDTSGALRASQLASVPADLRTDVTHALKRWLDDECATDPLLPAVGARLRAAYERGLAEADRSFGRILDGLDGLGLPAGTVVIVVGDHGEAFGEHGTLNHGRRLHDEMVRVPLIVRAPGRLGAPRIVRGPAGLVDVAPTILELAGVAVPSGATSGYVRGLIAVSSATRSDSMLTSSLPRYTAA